MAGFKFRLEPVLQVRQMLEQAAQQELAQTEQARLTAALELNRTSAELDGVMGASAVLRSGVTENLHYEYYRAVLHGRKQAQESELEERDHAVEQKRGRLVEAMRDKMVLQKLREKQEKQFRNRESARLIKELDELGTMAFCFNKTVKGGE